MDWFLYAMIKRTWITIFGEENNHPVFRDATHINDYVRRIDLEIDFVDSERYKHDSEVKIVGFRQLHDKKDVYQAFHSCGGIFDIREIRYKLEDKELDILTHDSRDRLDFHEIRDKLRYKLEDKEWDIFYADCKGDVLEGLTRLAEKVSTMRCLKCETPINVSHTTSNAMANVFADAWVPPAVQELSVLHNLRSLAYHYHDLNPGDKYQLWFTYFNPSLLDKIYSRKRDYESLEPLLERLYPNVPASIMEQLLLETIGNIDATISSLEREVMLDAFGSSFSEAVGRFSLKNKASDRKYIVKVIKNKELAEKEILIANEAGKTLPLALYVPRVFGEHPISYKGYHLIVMEDVSVHGVPCDEHKEKAYRFVQERGKKVRSPILHRLYVMSLFHTSLARLAEHPLLRQNEGPLYYPRKLLEDSLSEYKEVKKIVPRLDEIYDDSIAFRKAYSHDRRRLVHGDAVERNWVHEHIIDFGNVHCSNKGGAVHRDLARIILSTIDLGELEPGFIKRIVDSYYAFRDFEEQKARASRTEREMENEYTHIFAELHIEAYRRLRTLGKRLPPDELMAEVQRHNTIGLFAKKEFMKRTNKGILLSY